MPSWENSNNSEATRGGDNNMHRQLEYHTFPSETHGMPQFQHVLKRKGDQHKLGEIFGSNQNFNRMSQIEANDAAGLRVPHSADQTNPWQSAGHTRGNQNQDFRGTRQNANQDAPRQTSNRDKVYAEFASYFQGFVLTKIRVFNNYSVYKAIAQCLLCDGGVRFIVAIVPNDMNRIGAKVPLSSLRWDSFQTRFQEDDSEIKQFNIQTFAYNRLSCLTDKIRLLRQTTNSNMYQCDVLPLQVEVLREKEDYYADTGTVGSALELFNTIVSFI